MPTGENATEIGRVGQYQWSGGYSCVPTAILWVNGKGVGSLYPENGNGKCHWIFKPFDGGAERRTSFKYQSDNDAKREVLAFLDLIES